MAKDEIAKQKEELKAKWAELSVAQDKLDKELERLKGKWADLSAAQDRFRADQEQLEKDGKDLAEAATALAEEKADTAVRQGAMAPAPTLIDPKANTPLSSAEEGEFATLEARAGNGTNLPGPPDMLKLARLRLRSKLE